MRLIKYNPSLSVLMTPLRMQRSDEIVVGIGPADMKHYSKSRILSSIASSATFIMRGLHYIVLNNAFCAVLVASSSPPISPHPASPSPSPTLLHICNVLCTGA